MAHAQATPSPAGPPAPLPCPLGSKLFPLRSIFGFILPPRKDHRLSSWGTLSSWEATTQRVQMPPPAPRAPPASPWGEAVGSLGIGSGCPMLQGACPTARVGKRPSQTCPPAHPLRPCPRKQQDPGRQVRKVTAGLSDKLPFHFPGKKTDSTPSPGSHLCRHICLQEPRWGPAPSPPTPRPRPVRQEG